MKRHQIRQAMMHLPMMAIYAQALRQSGKLGGLDLESSKMAAVVAGLSRMLTRQCGAFVFITLADASKNR
jgi:hypothetical protein